jgi:hypothetical protein
MNKHILRSCMIVALLALTATQPMASAQAAPRLEGAWKVSVTVLDCATGDVIRTPRALNLFGRDGSVTETADNALRGPSVGQWRHLQANNYTSTFWFFRRNPDGTFAATVKVTRTIELGDDGNHFVSTGTVEDFNADGVMISSACATETAERLE